MNIRGELSKKFYARGDELSCERFREEKPEIFSQCDHIEERDVVWNQEILPMNCGMATELYLRSQSLGLKYINLDRNWTDSNEDFKNAIDVFTRAGVKTLTMTNDASGRQADIRTLLLAGWQLVFSVDLNIPVYGLNSSHPTPALVFIHN